jgi:hypothetical protein
MESKVKIAGHGVHPILIVVPLGLLATAVTFDVIRAFNDSGDLAVAGFLMIAAGICWSPPRHPAADAGCRRRRGTGRRPVGRTPPSLSGPTCAGPRAGASKRQ